MDRLQAWARQPSSVAGIATVFGTLSALLTHQLSLLQATPILAGAVMSIALPDNSEAVSAAETVASTILASATRVTRKEGSST
jgi:hypothetical protein